MNDKETLGEKLREAVGLPGRRLDETQTPDLPRDAPSGTLTADDTEKLAPHGDVGTGLKREED